MNSIPTISRITNPILYRATVTILPLPQITNFPIETMPKTIIIIIELITTINKTIITIGMMKTIPTIMVKNYT